MKQLLFLFCLLPGWLAAQTGLAYSPQASVYSPVAAAAQRYTADSLVKTIAAVGQQHSFAQLWQLLEACKKYGSQSKPVAENLAAWLNEGHPIYAEKGYNETLQFRAYLLYALSFFPPTDELLKYVVYELNFADNKNIIGAAIYTARLFPGDSSLMALAEKYSADGFAPAVNFTSPDVLQANDRVTTIQKEAIATARMLRPDGTKHSCCSSGANSLATKNASTGRLIPPKNRKAVKTNVGFYDQYGKQVTFSRLRGRPFLITFFYTSCTNLNKCASTIQQLGQLQKKMDTENIGPVGIYSISYDTYVDKPEVLKKYGDAYGFAFTEYHRFMVSQNEAEKLKLFGLLGIKVGYGNGIVTQHGTQVFVFDKKGRIAMVVDNEVCPPDTLLHTLAKLKIE
jgi:cytochrome oxidase Cu insertion factor (SCO1/SenC/PrrC family)